jgi:hypothetical protein
LFKNKKFNISSFSLLISYFSSVFFSIKNRPWILILFISIFACYAFKGRFSAEGCRDIIRSDGSGYYAYLPAIFLFNDPTFEESSKMELAYAPYKGTPLYLYKTQEGTIYNKYFPGLAVMQTPFFGLATAVSYLANKPLNGYSGTYQFILLIGSVFYFVLGVLFMFKFLNRLFPNHAFMISWMIPAFYLASTMLHYSLFRPSITHHYSIFLFALLGIFTVNLKKGVTSKRLVLIGLVLALIFLVRPTNLLVICILPALFLEKELALSVWLDLKRHLGKNFLCLLFSSAIGPLILLLVWKWESGNWILWSYSGEGFNWFNPQIFEVLFGFRIGLFIHAPITLFSIVAVGYFIFVNKIRFFTGWFLLYFCLLTGQVAALWCWDYESLFGPRAYTEHFFFILLPMISFTIRSKNKIFITVILLFGITGGIRLVQNHTGQVGDLRLTASSYFSSFQFWKKETKGRYNATLSCHPFGKQLSKNMILNHKEEIHIDASKEFSLTAEYIYKPNRTTEKYYYNVSLDKYQKTASFEDAFLVIDAMSRDGKKRFYRSVSLYNDKVAETGKWTSLTIQGIIDDNFQEYDKVTLYIWNLGKKDFKLKNVKFAIEGYLAD